MQAPCTGHADRNTRGKNTVHAGRTANIPTPEMKTPRPRRPNVDRPAKVFHVYLKSFTRSCWTLSADMSVFQNQIESGLILMFPEQPASGMPLERLPVAENDGEFGSREEKAERSRDIGDTQWHTRCPGRFPALWSRWGDPPWKSQIPPFQRLWSNAYFGLLWWLRPFPDDFVFRGMADTNFHPRDAGKVVATILLPNTQPDFSKQGSWEIQNQDADSQ